MERRGEFLENAKVFGANRYGTPRTPVRAALADGRPVLLEIDVQGAGQVKAAMPEAMTVILLPPSWEALEARLRGRKTEDAAALERRLAVAKQELAAAAEFDHQVVNDDLEVAVGQVDRILMGTPPTEGTEHL